MACLVALTGAAFAQGTVNWLAISPAAFTAQTNSTQYFSPLFGGNSTGFGTIGNTFNQMIAPNGYYFELLYLPGGSQESTPTTLAALSAWADSGLSAIPDSAGFGRFQPVNPSRAATVPWAAGVTNSIMLAGWSANLAAGGPQTWGRIDTVLNSPSLLASVVGPAYFGLSNTGYEAPLSTDPGSVFIGGGPNSTGTPIQSPLTQLYILPTPEPTTVALMGLSGLMLMLSRRGR
jgi:hypothetical protein